MYTVKHSKLIAKKLKLLKLEIQYIATHHKQKTITASACFLLICAFKRMQVLFSPLGAYLYTIKKQNINMIVLNIIGNLSILPNKALKSTTIVIIRKHLPPFLAWTPPALLRNEQKANNDISVSFKPTLNPHIITISKILNIPSIKSCIPYLITSFSSVSRSSSHQ